MHPALGFALGALATLALLLPIVKLTALRSAARTRQLLERAHTAERLAELGTLTGGLAHELRNPLSTVRLNLQLLRESLEDAQLPPELRSRATNRLDAVAAETDRLSGILEDFLSFAGKMHVDAKPVDINHLLEELADFFHAQADASGIRLRTQLDPAVGKINADPTLLKQAVLNLLINATQAMVEARYSDKPHGGAEDLIIKTVARNHVLEIHVIDTGPGIPSDVHDKIFQPYFSTKKKGTGLGLATTRRIAHEHQGQLTFHTTAARGTDFTFTLPRPATSAR